MYHNLRWNAKLDMTSGRFFCGIFHALAPKGIEQQQTGDDEEHLADAKHRCEMAAEKSSGEHTDELRRLVEAVNAAHAERRRQLAYECVDGWHEAGDRNAMDKTQQSKLPGRGDKPLREGDKTSQQQAGGQDLLRADAVREMADF